MRYFLLVIALVSLFSFSCDKPQTKTSAETTPIGNTGALRSEVVPKEFQHLLPLAQKWGIGDDIERGNLENKTSRTEKQELSDAVRPYRQQINSWLETFLNAPMPDEAAAFLYMLEAMEEMGL